MAAALEEAERLEAERVKIEAEAGAYLHTFILRLNHATAPALVSSVSATAVVYELAIAAAGIAVVLPPVVAAVRRFWSLKH